MGFGEGALLTKAERAGWECFGTELSPIALQHGRGRGWIVSDNPASDPRFTPRSFDIVSMIELLEHVDDARSILTTAHDYLRPGGRLYLTTPNARSLNRWVLGSNWSIVAPPEHVTLWTARGIRAALRLIGFSDIRIRTEGLNPVEFSARVARLGPVDGHERTNAAARLNEIASGGSVRRMLKRGINAALNLLHIGDTLKVSAIKS